MTLSRISGLTTIGVSGIEVSSAANLKLSVAQAQALETCGLEATPQSGYSVTASDSAANLEALTASQISGLTAIGVSGLTSTDVNVSYSPTQTAAILSSGLSVSAPGSDTVTENFANGNSSVYRGGQLIQQETINADGSYDIAYLNVTGKTYSSYEDIFNSAGTLVAAAWDFTNGSGNLLLYANGLTVTSSLGTESVTTGADTFGINGHTAETITATNMQSETFVFGPGFGRIRSPVFSHRPASHVFLAIQRPDVRLFVHNIGKPPMRRLCSATMLRGRPTRLISVPDPQGDTLTINNRAVSTFHNNLGDFSFK